MTRPGPVASAKVLRRSPSRDDNNKNEEDPAQRKGSSLQAIYAYKPGGRGSGWWLCHLHAATRRRARRGEAGWESSGMSPWSEGGGETGLGREDLSIEAVGAGCSWCWMARSTIQAEAASGKGQGS